MTDNKERKIEVVLNDGKTVEGEILFFFEESGDTFILYKLEDDDENVFPAKLKDDNSLVPIDEDEWEIVERIFQEWIDEQEDDDGDEDK